MRDKGARFVVSENRERDMAGKRPAYVIAEVEITDAVANNPAAYDQQPIIGTSGIFKDER
jgi:hypothetical protein